MRRSPACARARVRAWHFCLGNAWGSTLRGMTAGGYGKILARYADLEAVDEFVLDYACREMAGIEALACLPKRQARRRRRRRRPLARDRVARANRGARAQGPRRRSPAYARDAHDRLRDEAAPTPGRRRQAAIALGGGANRPSRAHGLTARSKLSR